MKKGKIIFYVLIFLLFYNSIAYCLTMHIEKPTIGLALGEGGIRGMVHVGVIKALLDAGYNVDYIAGTSIGSMVGGLYALWKDIDKVEDFMLDLNLSKFTKPGTTSLTFQKFGDTPYLTLYFDLLNSKSETTPLSGLINSLKIRDELDILTDRASIDYDLKIPYKAIATDLISGKKIVIESGRLSNAIAASICVPGMFSPLPYGNMYLIDGGIKDPVPVDIVHNMGADIIIAVSLRGISEAKEIEVDNVISIIERAIYIMIEDRTKEAVKGADILIAPKLKVKSLGYDITKKEKLMLIEVGEKMMKEALPLLEERIKNLKR